MLIYAGIKFNVFQYKGPQAYNGQQANPSMASVVVCYALRNVKRHSSHKQIIVDMNDRRNLSAVL